ncbi:hypothetical protein JTB14_012907 [Gonioctena quinquepunctata]|nr:hypothetical protein JTB14_012907 [Gonioctena quinquepunctata]
MFFRNCPEITLKQNTQSYQQQRETSSPEIVHVTESAPGIFRGKLNTQSYPILSETSSQGSVQAIVHVSDPPVAVQNNAHGNNLQNYLEAQRADIVGNALLESTGFHETIISLLSHIKIQNAQILALLQNKEEAKIKEFPFAFPMKSVDDIQALEKLLEDKKQVDVLISYLATIGGRDLSGKVSRILKHLFLDTLAAKYSFYGKRSNKRPFSELCLKTVVLNSAKKSCPKSTDKDIEDCFSPFDKYILKDLFLANIMLKKTGLKSSYL